MHVIISNIFQKFLIKYYLGYILILPFCVDILYQHCNECNATGFTRSPLATIVTIVLISLIIASLKGRNILKINLSLSNNLFLVISLSGLSNFIFMMMSSRLQYFSLLLFFICMILILFPPSFDEVSSGLLFFIAVNSIFFLLSLFLFIFFGDLSSTPHHFRGYIGSFVNQYFLRQRGIFSSPSSLGLSAGLFYILVSHLEPKKFTILKTTCLITALFLVFISETRSVLLGLTISLFFVELKLIINKLPVNKHNLVTLILCIIYFIQLGVSGFFEGAQARYQIWDQSAASQKVIPSSVSEADAIKAPHLFSHSHNFLLDIFDSENYIYRFLALLIVPLLLFFLIRSWRRGLNISVSIILFLLVFSCFELGLRFDTLTMPMSFLFISVLVFKYPIFSVFHKPSSNFDDLRSH